VHAQLVRHLKAAVADGTVNPDADLEMETVLLTAAIDGLCIQWLLDPSIDIARLRPAYRHAAPRPDLPEGRCSRPGTVNRGRLPDQSKDAGQARAGAGRGRAEPGSRCLAV
jgi:transcriptional regulator BetI-like protein